MADMLASVDDLASLLGSEVDTARATVVLEAATAVVQAAVRQRLLLVTETVNVPGDISSWLSLPERPASAVTAVELDGEPVTDYTVQGSRLWRACGWQPCYPAPSAVTVAYTHGYAPDDPRLQLARSAVLMLAAGAYSNPTGAVSERVGDYSVTYAAATAAQMDQSPMLAKALQRQYGRMVGVVRQGE